MKFIALVWSICQCKRKLQAYTTLTVRGICTFAVSFSVSRPFCSFTLVQEGHFVLCYKEKIELLGRLMARGHKLLDFRCYLHVASLSLTPLQFAMCQCIVFCSFLMQDIFLNLQEFAFEGQNMTLTVNVLFTCITYCDAGPGYDQNCLLVRQINSIIFAF